MQNLQFWNRVSVSGAVSSAIALGAVALSLGSMLLATPRASAQAAYGSYVGIGGSLGFTDGAAGESSSSGGVVAVRYRLLELPISLRAQVLIDDTIAVVPTVSYDIPLNWRTDAYIGAGVAFQDGDEDTSPIGNQTSFVIQPGIDYSFPYSNFVVFGNAIIAFDAYREGGGTAASLQGGVGLRF
jgi:hypothetical protein